MAPQKYTIRQYTQKFAGTDGHGTEHRHTRGERFGSEGLFVWLFRDGLNSPFAGHADGKRVLGASRAR